MYHITASSFKVLFGMWYGFDEQIGCMPQQNNDTIFQVLTAVQE